MRQPRISLEQWAAFKAVVDEGSFARAAEVLNKSQSSVSYALARLEEALPAPVFDRGGRQARLTEAGKALYRQATALLEQATGIEQTARYLAGGWEAEVSLAMDALIPTDRLLCALHRFSLNCPRTRLRVLETTLSGTAEALLQRSAQIALIAQPPPGFLAQPLYQDRIIAVAHPGHPLFTLERGIREDELRNHRQIVIRDSGTRRQVDAGWLGAEERWTVSSAATSLEAVKAGLGFAFLPLLRVQSALDAGEVRRLPLAWGGERPVQVHLVLADRELAGPATRAVADTLLQEFRTLSASRALE